MLEASSSSDGTKRAAEVAVFHQDMFLLDWGDWGFAGSTTSMSMATHLEWKIYNKLQHLRHSTLIELLLCLDVIFFPGTWKDCTGTPRWTRLWPRPGMQLTAAPEAAVLPEDLLTRGGGADAECLSLAVHQGMVLHDGGWYFVVFCCMKTLRRYNT